MNIKNDSATNKVINYFLAKIKNGNLKPGDKLGGQNKISEELNISRVSVREAMHALKITNIINIIPGKGIFISSLSPELLLFPIKIAIPLNKKNLQDLTDLRICLEATCIEEAINNIKKDNIKELEKILKIMNFHKVEKDYEEFFTSDDNFHKKIFEIANNLINSSIFDFINYNVRSNFGFQKNGSLDEHYKRHEKIFERIKNKDVAGAKSASKENFKINLRGFLKSLNE